MGFSTFEFRKAKFHANPETTNYGPNMIPYSGHSSELQRRLRIKDLTLEQVVNDYHIKATRHSKYRNLIHFKYSQIDSPISEKIVQECRGLILDENDQWRCVARPFDKFFNLEEPLAAKLDWSTARVYEKLDGSLCYLYFYDDMWHVATSGSPDASGDVCGHGVTFAQLFWRVFFDKGYKIPSSIQKHLTFMFELMTPMNRVVVRHRTNDLKLLAARTNNDGYEFMVNQVWGFEMVQRFDLYTLDKIKKSFEIMNPLDQEGYVVVDHLHRRVKVKHPGYVVLHHLKDQLTPRRILEIVRNGEQTEFLSYFPEWDQKFKEAQARFNKLVHLVALTFSVVNRDTITQKDFALRVKQYFYSPLLFELKKGKVGGIFQALREIPIDRLMRYLDAMEKPKVDEDEVTTTTFDMSQVHDITV